MSISVNHFSRFPTLYWHLYFTNPRQACGRLLSDWYKKSAQKMMRNQSKLIPG